MIGTGGGRELRNGAPRTIANGHSGGRNPWEKHARNETGDEFHTGLIISVSNATARGRLQDFTYGMHSQNGDHSRQQDEKSGTNQLRT